MCRRARTVIFRLACRPARVASDLQCRARPLEPRRWPPNCSCRPRREASSGTPEPRAWFLLVADRCAGAQRERQRVRPSMRDAALADRIRRYGSRSAAVPRHSCIDRYNRLDLRSANASGTPSARAKSPPPDRRAGNAAAGQVRARQRRRWPTASGRQPGPQRGGQQPAADRRHERGAAGVSRTSLTRLITGTRGSTL
jgi:hypothetical protein